MKILFVIDDMGLMDPLGIAYLSAVASSHERAVCILKRQDIAKSIAAKPDLVAYSCNSCEAQDIFKTHQSKVAPSGIFSIMGGPHATFYPDSIKGSGMEAYCIGEGELVFREVLDRLSQGASIDDVDGIRTRDKQNKLHQLAELDNLPMPDRDLILSKTFLGNFPRKTFITSRGCHFNCSYCFNPTLRQMYGPKWVRRFSVDRVIAEIKYIRSKYRLEFVKFDDDIFATKADKWLEEFSYRYRKEINLPFNCLLCLEHTPDELLRLLKEAGCHSVISSIDSASERIRREITGRYGSSHYYSNEEIADSLLRIHRYGIKTFVNYITGLPTAAAEDELGSLELSRKGKVTYTNYTTLVPFKGTRIWDYCKEHGLYSDTYIPKSFAKPSALKGFTPEQRRIQRNVLLLGAYARILPKFTIKHIPPNILFVLLYSLLKSRKMGREIYPLKAHLLYRLKISVKALIADLEQC